MIPILYIPPEKIKKLLVWMNIISIATLVSMMIWCLSAAHGAGPLLSQPSIVRSGKELGWLIVLGMPQ
jgi:NCS1 family nucleobase:cation symporter-1